MWRTGRSWEERREETVVLLYTIEKNLFSTKIYVQIGHQSARDAHVNQVFKETSKWQNSRNRYTYCICEPHKFFNTSSIFLFLLTSSTI